MRKDQQATLNESLLSNHSQNQSEQQRKKSQFKKKYLQQDHVVGGKNTLSQIFFLWIAPLLKYGMVIGVEVEAMPKLPQRMKVANEYVTLDKIFYDSPKSGSEGWTLTKSLYKTYKRQCLTMMVILVIVVSLTMYGPFLASQIMDYIKDRDNRSQSEAIILFIVTVVVNLVRNVGLNQMYFQFAIIGFNLTNSLTMMIYCKSLKYPSLSEKDFGIAQIINYSQVDAERMTYMGYQLASILFTPIQLVIGIWLMYYFIGISFLSGIVVMIITMLLTFFFVKKSIKYNESILKVKDQRMNITQQMFDIIRYIKINAIEKYFFKKVNKKRQQQINLYIKKGLMDVFTIFIYWLACPLILSSIFATYIWIGNEMNATVAFTTLMIFSILQYPIRALPTAISEFIQIFTSIKRIEKYLFAKQLDLSHIQQEKHEEFAIKISDGTFYWGVEEKKNQEQKDQKQKKNSKKDKKKKNEINEEQKEYSIIEEKGQKEPEKHKYLKALKNINTSFKKGAFTMIVGDIGSGKSSLLLAILNQMKASNDAFISIDGKIAYSSQKPWIMSSTVRQNITFTLPYDKQKFDRVVKLACLESDLQILANGQLTEIGQKGINLSGGQKARISLARTLYSQRDIYLLDDILSAVDVHVADNLMKNVLLDLLKGRTILLTTHAIKYVEIADEIIIMKKGEIVKKGHYHQIKETKEFQEIILKEKQHIKEEDEQDEEKILKEQAQLRNFIKKSDKEQEAQRKKQTQTDKLVEQLMLPQDHKTGDVDLTIFKEYINLNGGIKFAMTILLSMLMWISFTTFSSIWLEKWCENPLGGNNDLWIYLGFSVASNIFIFIRVYLLVLSGAKQGQTVHKKMLKSLLYASLTKFYNRVPVGRIINRLTKDLRQLDEVIAFAIGNFLVSFFQLLSTLTICIYASTPIVVIPMLIILFACIKLRKYYLHTQRQVSRLEKSTNSPIVSGFTSAINGLSTIRAYQKQKQFTQQQLIKIDHNKRVRIARQALEEWFSVGLSFLSMSVNMSAVGYSLFSGNNNPSLIGLLMNYALNLSDDVIATIFSQSRFETKIVSLERIYNFMKIQPQPAYLQYCSLWHTKEEGVKNVIENGQMQFYKTSSRYREDLPDVLKQLTFKIKAGEKIGIVGRTGAGKSTVINLLLGLTQLSNGQLLIDGKPINQFFIKDLRSSITMIDQQPTLIKSTFRENLDITHQYSDEQLYDILKECNLFDIIMEKEGLDGKVSNDSLSVGQKQLLCICRAFLKKSKVVLIDEATANIDMKNDALIQEVIKNKFVSSTVLTIAHRLSTLKNSDKILVLGEGQVLEWGTPKQLEEKEEGVYSQMVKQNLKQFLA